SIRLATLTGAEARSLGILGGCVETYVLAQRVPGRAGGAAVDAGGHHCSDECAVPAGIAGLYGGPASVVALGGRYRVPCSRSHHAQEHSARRSRPHPEPCFQTALRRTCAAGAL